MDGTRTDLNDFNYFNVTMNLRAILEYQLLHIGDYVLTVSNVLGVLLIWLTVWIIIRLARRIIYKGFKSMVGDRGRRHSLFLIVQYIVWVLATMGIFRVIGLDISVLLAGSAAFLVGIGLGLQQIFRDIASGVFLLFEGTIEVGDIIQVDGTVGKVEQINLRTSTVLTRDGLTMIVPNHKFIVERVINWSHQDRAPSRFFVSVTVHYNADEKLVRQLLLDCAIEHPDVVTDDPDRPPQARLTDFNKADMVFEMLFWTYRKFEVEIVRSDLRYALREKFRQYSIQEAPAVEEKPKQTDEPLPLPPAEEE
ncbi:MAG TPA: mechanosensitive ion channel [Saprospiraceae bacterium]|nr:mechanosensitive ion channel [Saprospiraceae bacterium]